MNNNRQIDLVIPYYVILFLLMVLMGSATEPSMAVRLMFLAVFIVPLFMFKYLMSPVIICTVTLLSVTDKVLFLPLPYTDYFYYFIIILILFLQRGKKQPFDILLPFILFWLYILFVDLVTGSKSLGMRQYFPMLLMLGMVCSGFHGEKRSMFLLMNAFCLISFLSSLLFFINYNTFLVQYSSFGLERSGWKDPNYFSCILGMGVVAAIIQLMRKEKNNSLVKIFWIATIATSFVSQILLASRGGILAVVIAFLVALLFVKIPTKYKLLITIIAFGFVVYLYNNGYFELLEYRFSEDTTGGSGRTYIWKHKLYSYFGSSNPLNLLFGYGYNGGLQLGFNKNVGIHNDFIAMMVEYGLVGLGFLLWGFIRPYKQAAAKYKSVVLVMLVYLAVVCITLEPLTQGNFAYMSFFMVIYYLSKC